MNFPPAFSFSKPEYDKSYKMIKVYDGVHESEGYDHWTARVIWDGTEYIMFLKQKNDTHRYLRSELDKYFAGDEFYFTKIDLGEKGKRFFIHPCISEDGEQLQPPVIEKLYREATGDRSMTTTERTFLTASAFLCKDNWEETFKTYLDFKKSFSNDLTPDQRNLLFTCSIFGGTVEDVKNKYEHFMKLLW